jgi:hypothetical protein
VRLVSGVVEGERVALNLGSEIEEGGAVQVVETPARPGAATASGAGPSASSAR